MPERIGRYRVTGTLGEGGMGVVFHAVDERLQRSVALKVIRRDVMQSDAARERFWREARLAASVIHPNICQIYEVAEEDGELFMAMERLEGEPLSAQLTRGALPLADSVRIGLEILDALAAVHLRGIVHRDLTPSNVFLTRHGAKLLDFGLAKPLVNHAETAPPLTVPGILVGTPRYIAPEQLLGTPTDGRSDLFALGAILYEMLAGVPAFAADSVAATLEKLLRADPPVLGGSPAVAALDRVIHRALAKALDRRYATAGAMADDLRRIYSEGDHTTRARTVTRLIVLPFRLLREDNEIDFLAFSLADAVSHSLSQIESLVVRSPLAAGGRVAEIPDLKRIASEADVDAVLSGTLLRAGDQLRSSVQLVAAPSGSLISSHTSQVSIRDVFQLQDDLARKIVEDLALPLSRREQQALGGNVPANAHAYEFYLRGNQLSQDVASLELARDLYLQSTQADPRYAPAWARLGRVYRIIGKFRSEPGASALAESALNRALNLNPDLSMADRFYAQIEVDAGRAQHAMVRLLRRARSCSNDADLFAALVSACRYCGLLKPSIAANERARRLDPNIPTSIQHTFVLVGDYLRAAREPRGVGTIGGIALAMAGHPDAAREIRLDGESARAGNIGPMIGLYDQVLAMIEGRGDVSRLRAVCHAIVASGLQDPEARFYMALYMAHFGGEREYGFAIELLTTGVERGYFPVMGFIRHPWLDPLRNRPDFAEVLRAAEQRSMEARDAFRGADGEALLGPLD